MGIIRLNFLSFFWKEGLLIINNWYKYISKSPPLSLLGIFISPVRQTHSQKITRFSANPPKHLAGPVFVTVCQQMMKTPLERRRMKKRNLSRETKINIKRQYIIIKTVYYALTSALHIILAGSARVCRANAKPLFFKIKWCPQLRPLMVRKKTHIAHLRTVESVE